MDTVNAMAPSPGAAQAAEASSAMQIVSVRAFFANMEELL
jgi:hypothetical protein